MKMSRAFPDGVCVNEDFIIIQPRQSRSKNSVNEDFSVCVRACVLSVNEDFIIIQPRQSRSKNDIEKREPKR